MAPSLTKSRWADPCPLAIARFHCFCPLIPELLLAASTGKTFVHVGAVK